MMNSLNAECNVVYVEGVVRLCISAEFVWINLSENKKQNKVCNALLFESVYISHYKTTFSEFDELKACPYCCKTHDATAFLRVICMKCSRTLNGAECYDGLLPQTKKLHYKHWMLGAYLLKCLHATQIQTERITFFVLYFGCSICSCYLCMLQNLARVCDPRVTLNLYKY